MKKIVAVLLLSTVAAAPTLARDTTLRLPLAEVLEMPDAKAKLDGVKFYLAGQKTPKVTQKMGEDISNRKTNNFGKEDRVACQWAALSALLAFHEKARGMVGANAVVDIESYYKRNSFKSSTEYECHAGAVIAGVTLRGAYAKVAR